MATSRFIEAARSGDVGLMRALHAESPRPPSALDRALGYAAACAPSADAMTWLLGAGANPLGGTFDHHRRSPNRDRAPILGCLLWTFGTSLTLERYRVMLGHSPLPGDPDHIVGYGFLPLWSGLRDVFQRPDGLRHRWCWTPSRAEEFIAGARALLEEWAGAKLPATEPAARRTDALLRP